MGTPSIGLGCGITIGGTAQALLKSIDTAVSTEFGTVETTYLGSTYRTFIPTIGDGGTIAFTANYDPTDATHIALFTAQGTSVAMVLQLHNSKTFAASVILTKFTQAGFEVDSLLTVAVEGKVTGWWTAV